MPAICTVDLLAKKYSVKPIEIRKVLRSAGIQPKKVPVEGGWANQQRRQYQWELQDPELEKVLIALTAKFQKDQQG